MSEYLTPYYLRFAVSLLLYWYVLTEQTPSKTLMNTPVLVSVFFTTWKFSILLLCAILAYSNELHFLV